MRFLTAALLAVLLASFAAPRPAAAKSNPVMESVDKRLDEIEALARKKTSGQPSAQDQAEDCRSSFTVTSMAVAVRGWMMQGSPLRGVLTGKGEFEEFSKQTLGEVTPMIQQYQNCLANATGRTVCEPMQLLGAVNTSEKGGMVCGEPGQAAGGAKPPKEGGEGVVLAENIDDEFVYAVVTGRRDAALGYCERSLGDVGMFSKQSLRPACDAIIGNFNNTSAACERLKALVEPSRRALLPNPCPIGSLVGDAAACPLFTGENRTGCERRAAIRRGKVKPAKANLAKAPAPESADPTCSRSIAKLRSWYCGRFSRPAFERLGSSMKSQTKNLAQAERADRRAKAIAALKDINDQLASLVISSQMGVLPAEDKERLSGLLERRDRASRLLNDGKAPAPRPKRPGRAAEGQEE